MLELDTNILDWLGPSERKIIQTAQSLLKIGKPPSDQEKEAYRNHLLIQQEAIINLEANVSYILSIKDRNYNQRKFDLWDYSEFSNYTKTERESVAVIRDEELSDINETLIKLKILQRYLDKLSWVLKDASR